MAESIKSIYKPSHPEKYQGNPNNIVCRSSWERRFCYYCDHNPDIVSWASEEFCIKYISPVDNRIHRYFPDYLIKVKEQSGNIKTYVIEVKPKKQTVAPAQNPKRKTKYWKQSVFEYVKNVAKWDAAKEWCEDRSMTFKILTEEDLGL